VQAFFEAAGLSARELQSLHISVLQALFKANPDYFLAINWRPPTPHEVQQAFEEMPRAHMAYGRGWFAGAE
jgi:hypothetical protein